jgi:beta-galactosidase
VLFADWTPTDLGAHAEHVEVYSNAEKVELFLNGKSLGAQPRPADDSPRLWKVPFEPGTLKAVATNANNEVATHELRTAGKPAKLQLDVDRNRLPADWNDVAAVTINVVDEKGVIVPTASDEITFTLKGPGVIAAVDNADNSSHEPFQANHRHAHQDRCVAFLKASAAAGHLTLTASAPGLTGGSVTLEATGASAH